MSVTSRCRGGGGTQHAGLGAPAPLLPGSRAGPAPPPTAGRLQGPRHSLSPLRPPGPRACPSGPLRCLQAPRQGRSGGSRTLASRNSLLRGPGLPGQGGGTPQPPRLPQLHGALPQASGDDADRVPSQEATPADRSVPSPRPGPGPAEPPGWGLWGAVLRWAALTPLLLPPPAAAGALMEHLHAPSTSGLLQGSPARPHTF